jgi:hypothetical protein
MAIQWVKNLQTHQIEEPFNNEIKFHSTYVNPNSNSLYVLAIRYANVRNQDSNYIYLNDNNILTYSGFFFLRLNKETGEYISHGTHPLGDFNLNLSVATITSINNQVFAQIPIMVNYIKSIDIVRWKEDGTLIDTINVPTTIPSSSSRFNMGDIMVNDNGDLVISGKYCNNIYFDDMVLQSTAQQSKCYIAKYHDSSFAVPYGTAITDVPIENSAARIYPNPTSGEVTVSANQEAIRGVVVYNLNGQKIFEKEHINQNETQINLSHHAAGLYVVKIITQKSVYVRKLMLNSGI